MFWGWQKIASFGIGEQGKGIAPRLCAQLQCEKSMRRTEYEGWVCTLSFADEETEAYNREGPSQGHRVRQKTHISNSGYFLRRKLQGRGISKRDPQIRVQVQPQLLSSGSLCKGHGLPKPVSTWVKWGYNSFLIKAVPGNKRDTICECTWYSIWLRKLIFHLPEATVQVIFQHMIQVQNSEILPSLFCMQKTVPYNTTVSERLCLMGSGAPKKLCESYKQLQALEQKEETGSSWAECAKLLPFIFIIPPDAGLGPLPAR